MDTRATPPIAHGTPAAVRGLDRLPPEALIPALGQLRAQLEGNVWVVVDPMPADPGNAARQTVRPVTVWRRLLAAAGFDILNEEAAPDVAIPGGAWSVRAHWRRLRPWRDVADRAPRSFLVRVASGPSATDVDTRLRALLGIRPACSAPAALQDADTHLVFLVGTHQEFRQYLPLWQQLPRDRFSVLLRQTRRHDDAVLRREVCVAAWLRGRGIDTLAVRQVSDIDWSRWPQRRRGLVCGADSTAYDVHLWNAAVVVAAKQRGFATVQMQHGIWPYADQQEPMTLLSDTILTWSTEFEGRLSETVSWPDGTSSARAALEGVRFTTTGCPVFDSYADDTPVQLEDLLGDWVLRYRHHVLVATNLHWSQHARGSGVHPALIDVARARPDTLFVLKLHPVHDVDDGFLTACPDNVVVLDELCCLFADLDSTRLVRAVNAVIATQSTVALEAALAGRPLLVIDTGNPNQYAHVPLTPLERLGDDLDAALTSARDTRPFRDHYFDITCLGEGTAGSLHAIASAVVPADLRTPSRADLAMARFSSRLSAYAADLAGTQADVARLEHELDAARAGLAHLASRSAALSPVVDARDAWLLRPRSDRRTRVVLFGASVAGRGWLRAVRGIEHLDAIAFVDNDAARHGTTIDGVPVSAPAPDVLASADVIIISSVHVAPIAAAIAAAGCADRVLADNDALARVAAPERIARAS